MEVSQEEKEVIKTQAHAAIQAARRVLEGPAIPQELLPAETSLQPLVPEEYTPPSAPPPGAFPQLFQNHPEQLRDPLNGVNLQEIRRLNLAAAIEALERAVRAHEGFPTADQAIAVATLSERVEKLVRDIDKARDPRELYCQIADEVLLLFAEQTVRALAQEMKWLQEQSDSMLLPEKQQIFRETVREASKRIGPALKYQVEASKRKLMVLLNIKDDDVNKRDRS
jgi:hypothetical protein